MLVALPKGMHTMAKDEGSDVGTADQIE